MVAEWQLFPKVDQSCGSWTSERKKGKMARVIVKLWPGKSEEQKTRLSEAITKQIMEVLHYGEESVSCGDGISQTSGLGRECL